MVRLTKFAFLFPNLFMLRKLQRIGNISSTCLGCEDVMRDFSLLLI